MSKVTIPINGEITAERSDLAVWVRGMEQGCSPVSCEVAALVKDGLAKVPKRYPLDLHVELTPKEARKELYWLCSSEGPASRILYDKLNEIAEKE